jgi:hypothetical protein
MDLWKSLLYRGLDFEGDVLKFPAFLDEAYQVGKEFAKVLHEEFTASTHSLGKTRRLS